MTETKVPSVTLAAGAALVNTKMPSELLGLPSTASVGLNEEPVGFARGDDAAHGDDFAH